MKSYFSKILIVALLVIAVALFFVFDLQRFFTLAHLKAQQEAFARFYAGHTVGTLALYFVVYLVMAALSLPGAVVMTLAGGALFGLLTGTLVVSFASTLGATGAFLVSRFLIRDSVQRKFGAKLAAINRGIERDGAFYLFTLRLVPVFPFFVINLVMGLTPIRTRVFYLVSQVGMLPGTLVFVNAGTQLARIETLKGILSPSLLFSFALLGIFPLVAKWIVALVRRRRLQTR